MIFDSHAHYDDEAFNEDREAILNSLPENGISPIVNVSAQLSGVTATVELTEKYPFIYGSVSDEVQRKWFIRQLELAKEVNLPVIIHSREASQETFDIMKEHHAGSTGGVIHCYSGSKEMAAEYLKMGYYIGIGGVVTFKNARVMKEVAAAVPLERILIETDCPYLAPTPYRGKRNSSLFLPYVIEEIAKLKGIAPKTVEETTWENAMRMYKING